MSITPKGFFDSIRQHARLPSSAAAFPKIVMSRIHGARNSDAVCDQLLHLISQQFSIAETVHTREPNRSNLTYDTNGGGNEAGAAGALWGGMEAVERRSADLLVALQARAAPQTAVIHIHPAPEGDRGPLLSLEACASVEITSPTDAAYQSLVCALVAAMSPTSHREPDGSVDDLAKRITAVSDELGVQIKDSLARSEVGEQTMVWQTYAACLHWLGANGGWVNHLVEATRYYHVSLNPLTRRTTPLLWATIQNNLGIALCKIDELAPSPQRLSQAIEAFESGLGAISPRQAPVLKSALNANLARANLRLFKAEADAQYLGRAIEAFETALRGQPKGQLSSRWASLCDGLGIALCELGTTNGDQNTLIQSINTFRAAQESRGQNQAGSAAHWTWVNLGRALCRLGTLQSGGYRLLEGAEILRKASRNIDRQLQPHNWSDVQDEIGAALLVAGRREQNAEHLYEAIAALTASLGARDRERHPAEWSLTQVRIGRAFHLLGKLLSKRDTEADRDGAQRCYESAERACSEAHAAYVALGATEQAEQMSEQIDKIRTALAAVSGEETSSSE